MTLNALKKHLESPRHQQSLYHCMKRSCGKEFKTLAELINHLESEICKIMRFQQVQKSIATIVDPHKMIALPWGGCECSVLTLYLVYFALGWGIGSRWEDADLRSIWNGILYLLYNSNYIRVFLSSHTTCIFALGGSEWLGLGEQKSLGPLL